MKTLLIHLWKEEDGQDLTEYALLLALVALSAILAMNSLASAINNKFAAAASVLNTTP